MSPVDRTVTTGRVQGVGGRLWWRSVDPHTDATPVVLLHGGPGMPSSYLGPLEVLADERRVVRYDQIGCGRSDAPDDPALWTVETFVEDLRRLADDLGLGRFHLLGHSWGGMLALAHAARHPERVASLVLASPLVSVDAWCRDADRLVGRLPDDVQRALRQPPDTAAYREAEAEFYRRHFCRLDPWPAPLRASFEALGAVAYQAMWGPNEFTQTGSLRGADLTPVVRSLTVPSLWICGSEDEATPETVRAFAAMNAASELVELPGGTHCVHLEQPGAFVGALRAFWRGVPPRGG